MSKIMKRLETLAEFKTKSENLRARTMGIQAEGEALDKAFAEWMTAEFGLKGQHHISDILKVALETSIEPTSKIIAPY
jgi:hypothetical protein